MREAPEQRGEPDRRNIQGLLHADLRTVNIAGNVSMYTVRHIMPVDIQIFK